MKTGKYLCALFIFAFLFALSLRAQSVSSPVRLTAADLQDEQPFDLGKLTWSYQFGDDPHRAARDFDDASWRKIEGTTLKPELLTNDWRGRAWFRLRLSVDETLAKQTFALAGTQRGATEIYLDGRKIAEFGKITAAEISEYNPNQLPIPFQFAGAGEHVLAVRFASQTFADPSSGKYS